jgi:diacylglycerol kinase (ATP)
VSLDKIVAIVNPIAGKGKCARLWPQVESYLKELGLQFEAYFTEKKGDATRLAASASDQGVDCLLSVGGDGTLNEVVNGVSQRPVTIGVIPTGSGNDFVRTLGLKPHDWRGACRIVAAGHARPMDLGQINGCHFANVAGVGFDAAVANCANVWAKQRFPGSIAYIAALLKVLSQFKPTDLTIELDAQTFTGVGWLVAVANAQYFGGGMWVAPKAKIDDGLFDVCILGELSCSRFLAAFPSVFSGKHLAHPAVHYYRSRTVKVSSADSLLVQADGELIGQTPQIFRLQPGRLSILCSQD